MKHISVSLVILLLMQYSFAQKNAGRVCFLGNDKKIHEWSCIEQNATKEDSLAETILNSLLKPIGLHAQFIMRECPEIQNFAALISEKSLKRYILYNKSVIDSIADPINRNWDKIAIYLHELAHHLSGNTSNLDDENILQQELYADEFSGMQMAKLKATLTQAEQFLNLVDNPSCDDDVDHSHPCLEKRLNAVEKGWYFGMGLEEFYKSTLSKRFASTTSKDFKKDNFLEPDSERFFEYNHCIRSDTPCNCEVILNEINLNIDFQSQTSSLVLKLTDKGGFSNYKCYHAKLDTIIFITGHFKKPLVLLPDQELSIDFPMHKYSQILRFTGLLSSLGIITGLLISPNEHGTSYMPVPNERGVQYLAQIKMFAVPPLAQGVPSQHH